MLERVERATLMTSSLLGKCSISALEQGDRLVVLAGLHQEPAEQGVELGVGGVLLQDVPDDLDRLVGLAGLARAGSQGPDDLGVVGLLLQGLADRGDRLVLLARPGLDLGQEDQVPGVPLVGELLGQLLQGRLGLGELAEVEEGEDQLAIDERVGGPLDRPAEQSGELLGPLGLGGDVDQDDPALLRVDRRGVGRDHLQAGVEDLVGVGRVGDEEVDLGLDRVEPPEPAGGLDEQLEEILGLAVLQESGEVLGEVLGVTLLGQQGVEDRLGLLGLAGRLVPLDQDVPERDVLFQWADSPKRPTAGSGGPGNRNPSVAARPLGQVGRLRQTPPDPPRPRTRTHPDLAPSPRQIISSVGPAEQELLSSPGAERSGSCSNGR